jgi:hypothetical protein
MLVGYVLGSTTIYKCLSLLTLQASNHSEVIKFDEELFPGPWIQRPADFKTSIAHPRNPLGSAVNTGPDQADSPLVPILGVCHFPR